MSTQEDYKYFQQVFQQSSFTLQLLSFTVGKKIRNLGEKNIELRTEM